MFSDVEYGDRYDHGRDSIRGSYRTEWRREKVFLRRTGDGSWIFRNYVYSFYKVYSFGSDIRQVSLREEDYFLKKLQGEM